MIVAHGYELITDKQELAEYVDMKKSLEGLKQDLDAHFGG